MTKGILGRKIGMTQVFSESGEVIPVTVVQTDSNVVLQKKTTETDGYNAVQLGFGDKKESRTNKPQKGHAEKANTAPKRFVREIREINIDDYELGQEVKADVFNKGDVVDVTGTTKGKGFQGAIKRHGQQRGPKTHGSHFHRGPGALSAIDPMRVFKGENMPGRMGGKKVTVQNLEIVKVDSERNVLLIKGNVPGAKSSELVIQTTIKETEAK
ncbi:50S ribosomal protein L3 [Tuberibacillus sp. Marseille-P3662]|uniref:50S ribosomal protein L3 n=1 Tax=Tuberibacillus sp. Marseille-P3662 TaxID=1965358 RepID=UPI000A1CEBC2|nr:50S ribosomal protein L3 [Tuberibacillus sp. Marseille-P3662]